MTEAPPAFAYHFSLEPLMLPRQRQVSKIPSSQICKC
uniref:Uncharacterized protein n=1 Tax=Picea sitchensis TaxID=3332 RepID=B8LPS6_PICSI|nr:unknown [Picea sitchensis]